MSAPDSRTVFIEKIGSGKCWAAVDADPAIHEKVTVALRRALRVHVYVDSERLIDDLTAAGIPFKVALEISHSARFDDEVFLRTRPDY